MALARQAMHDTEGSEYDRLFYPFLFEGGKASIEDVLAQVRHSTLEKCRQVIAYGRRGDIALGISTSGNSTNVLQALEQAKKQGLLTIGMTGYDGGKMMRSAAVDVCINSPSDHIPRIQEAQATAYHALIEVIHRLIRKENSL